MGTRTNVIDEQYVQFSFLSEGQKQRIFSEVLEVLQYTGVKIHHERAREKLKKHGCTVKGTRTYIPSQLVNVCLNTIPLVTTIHGWDGSTRLRIENGRTYFGPGPTCSYFLDPHTQKRRSYLKEDASMVARVCDALPEIGFVMSLGCISNVQNGMEEICEFAELVQNTTKPVIAWGFSKESCQEIHYIAIAMSGGEEELRHRPSYIYYNEPISPLVCDFHAIDKLIYCAEKGIPQIFAPANTSGATVPATHAGHLIVSLAESLVGLVVSQLFNPGACIIIGGAQSILDMRTALFSYGAPELSILQAGLTEMGQYIGLPMYSTGGCSDSNCVIDVQSALESTLSLHSAILSGPNLVHDIGFMESGMTGSLFQLVMADEVISMSKQIVNGIQVTEQTLAEKEIAQFGPVGDYRDTEYTKKRHSLHWQPTLMDRQSYEDWVASGSKSMKDRVIDKTISIIDEYSGPKEKLPQNVIQNVQDILKEAEKRVTKSKS